MVVQVPVLTEGRSCKENKKLQFLAASDFGQCPSCWSCAGTVVEVTWWLSALPVTSGKNMTCGLFWVVDK